MSCVAVQASAGYGLAVLHSYIAGGLFMLVGLIYEVHGLRVYMHISSVGSLSWLYLVCLLANADRQLVCRARYLYLPYAVGVVMITDIGALESFD